MNTFLNSKVEMKKLELSKTKCKKLHFGKENLCCPELVVHGEPMQSSDSEMYLGSLISTDINVKNIIDLSKSSTSHFSPQMYFLCVIYRYMPGMYA